VKIECHCGALIVDQTDDLPQKAYVIPDQEWFGVLEAISAAVERSGPAAEDKSAASRAARAVLWRVARSAWQCRECGRLYMDDEKSILREFLPAEEDVPRELFRSRPSAE